MEKKGMYREFLSDEDDNVVSVAWEIDDHYVDIDLAITANDRIYISLNLYSSDKEEKEKWKKNSIQTVETLQNAVNLLREAVELADATVQVKEENVPIA